MKTSIIFMILFMLFTVPNRRTLLMHFNLIPQVNPIVNNADPAFV